VLTPGVEQALCTLPVEACPCCSIITPALCRERVPVHARCHPVGNVRVSNSVVQAECRPDYEPLQAESISTVVSPANVDIVAVGLPDRTHS
jgi:hypothetical protein